MRNSRPLGPSSAILSEMRELDAVIAVPYEDTEVSAQQVERIRDAAAASNQAVAELVNKFRHVHTALNELEQAVDEYCQ